MSRQKRLASVYKEDIAKVKCCSHSLGTRKSPKLDQENKPRNSVLQDKATQASFTWQQMLRKDSSNTIRSVKNYDELPRKEKLSSKDFGKAVAVLRQLFNILIDSYDGTKASEEPLKTLKDVEITIQEMSRKCNNDQMMHNDQCVALAKDFWNTVLSDFTRKKVKDLQRKIRALEDEKNLAQKNVATMRRQLESGSQVLTRSLEEKAKNDAIIAEMKSELYKMISSKDKNQHKSAKLKLEEELSLKQKEFDKMYNLVTDMRTEIKNLERTNRSLRLNEDRLLTSLSTYQDGFHSLKQSLVGKVQDIKYTACPGSPTCSTFIESSNGSPLPRASTSSIRDPDDSNCSNALSDPENSHRPIASSQFNSQASLLSGIHGKKHSTSIHESPVKRHYAFSRVKQECQNFFGIANSQAVALEECAYNLKDLSVNMAMTTTHVTENLTAAELCSDNDL